MNKLRNRSINLINRAKEIRSSEMDSFETVELESKPLTTPTP